MPWQESTIMSLRLEFVTLASAPDANVRALCRRDRISPTTAYKWLDRYRAEGEAGLAARSRRPTRSPRRPPPEVEAQVVELRTDQPTWGARKLQRRLRDQGAASVPAAPNPITAILQRHDLIDPAQSQAHRPVQRFVAAAPNDLWHLDFTGHFAIARGRGHPLPVLDDHSRFLRGLDACPKEQRLTVEASLTALFRRYGLPWALLCANGPPWGNPHAAHDLAQLGAWLIRLGVEGRHGRPWHPQTQGKVERLNGTRTAEVLARRRFADLPEAQTAFDHWRDEDKQIRPHAALDLAVPLARYAPSPRPFPEALPVIVYPPGDAGRQVDRAGQISWPGRNVKLSAALAGQPVGVRPTRVDGVVEVRFGHQLVRTLDLRGASVPCFTADH